MCSVTVPFFKYRADDFEEKCFKLLAGRDYTQWQLKHVANFKRARSHTFHWTFEFFLVSFSCYILKVSILSWDSQLIKNLARAYRVSENSLGDFDSTKKLGNWNWTMADYYDWKMISWVFCMSANILQYF